MLDIQKLCAGYGRTPVIMDIDLTVQPGEIVTLVGANGAGKSTLVKTISGLLQVHSGDILFQGESIAALPPSDRVLRGIAHVPEGRQVFAGMTVADNLRLGGYVHRKHWKEEEVQQRIRQVCELFPALLSRMTEVAANLSGGQQQMLAIARGMMADPKLLIFDEPSLGLSPVLVSEMFRLIASLREQGLAILLSEQNARLSLGIADRGYVIENGRVAMAGSARMLLESADIASRYLGGGSSSGGIDESHVAWLTGRLDQLILARHRPSGPAEPAAIFVAAGLRGGSG
jgi:branched-chain amino acid transport system ATP-binding protein